jgi:hypothetical protein
MLLIFISTGASAWQVTPKGKFLSDSTRIGVELLYSLSVTYPLESDIVFPDSLYDFSPFELNQKDYFFTKSDNFFSFDSAVYNLSTFEIDTFQMLALPIWVIGNGDSIAYFPAPDTVILNHIVTQMPDSLALIDNTIYKEVNYAFNYPYFLISIGIASIVIFVIIYFYGKSIRRAYYLYKMKRSHERFVKAFNTTIHSNKHNWEKSLLEWKKYMEQLDEGPYTRLTTREITRKTKDKLLLNALKGIDRVIYGNYERDTGKQYFEDLIHFARNAYANRVKQIKYGTGS